MVRSSRKNNKLRKVHIEPNYIKHAEGSCLISMGDTRVICTASYEGRVPPFLRNKGTGWVTAEYSLLPRSTNTRNAREGKLGKQSARTVEIQRLISRSLRAAVDLSKLPECQIIIDCDVIQADGGTRTLSITGGYVALALAIKKLISNGTLYTNPMKEQVAAVSCGIVGGKMLLDLDYEEDSSAEVDANFIGTKKGGIIDQQATAEEGTFSRSDMNKIMDLAEEGLKELFVLQDEVL